MKTWKEIVNDPEGGQLVAAFMAYMTSTALPSIALWMTDIQRVADVYMTISVRFRDIMGVALTTFYHTTLTLTFVGFIAYIAIKKTIVRSPIKWSFERFLEMRQQIKSKGRSYWYIRCFLASGTNTSKKTINHISGFLKVEYTGEVYPVKFIDKGKVKSTEELTPIAPGESLEICIHLSHEHAPKGWKGLSPAVFLERFVPFRFYIIIDGKKFVHRFSEKKIKKELFSIIYRKNKKRRGHLFRDGYSWK